MLTVSDDKPSDLKSCVRVFKYSFKDSDDDQKAQVSFGMPYFQFAISEQVDSAEVTKSSVNGDSRKDKPLWVAVAENGESGIDSLEKWVREEPKIIELNLRSMRVLWSAKKCLIVTNAQFNTSAINAVIYFTFFELKVQALLEAITSFSKSVQRDAALTHQVSKKDLAQRNHVNEMTRWTWSARLQYAGIESGLNLIPDNLDADGKRLVTELANSINMTDRLEVLNDQLEIMEDLYELANDRLSEYTFYFNEYRLEVWIIILLIIESAIMLFEALAMSHHG